MNVPTDISIKELLTDFSPKMAQKTLEESGKAAELAGTEFTLTVDVSGDLYSYVVKDGKDFDVTEGALDNPQVVVKVTTEDLEKMIATQNLDMLLGLQNDLSLTKYNAMTNVKGTMTAELETDEGDVLKIIGTLNGAPAPACTFKMKIADSAALIKKETSPVTLFMGGQMKIEGDMAFAMSTQPLFT